jgi:hypothetical protein
MKETSRQTVILLIVVLVGGTAFAAWEMVISPLNEREDTIKRLRGDLKKKEAERDTIALDLRMHERTQRSMSLPSDQSLALNEYGKLLQNLLIQSRLQLRDFKPGAPDSRNAPQLPNKKAAYTRLTYSIQARGDLFSLVEFMYSLYRQPLLHQIRKLTIQAPQSNNNPNTRAARTEDLEITMTIEALIIEKGENRPTLFSTSMPASTSMIAGGMGATAWMKFPSKNLGYGSPFPVTGVLSPNRDEDQSDHKQTWKHPPIPHEYLKISGKNIFTGPAPVTTQRETPQAERKYAPFIKLNEVSCDSEGNAQASIRNLLLKSDYTVVQSEKGEIFVQGFYYINKTAKEHTLTVRRSYGAPVKGKFEYDDEGKGEDNHKEYVILRIIDNSDLLIQRIEDFKAQKPVQTAAGMFLGGAASALYPGKVYRWHLGQTLMEAVDSKKMMIADENGEEQMRFVPVEPLSAHVAQAAMLTKGAFPENVPDPKNKQSGKGIPKKGGWGGWGKKN